MKEALRSESTLASMPKMANKLVRQSITAEVEILEEGKVKGKRRNSSMIESKNVLGVEDVSGYLNSILNRSEGSVALTNGYIWWFEKLCLYLRSDSTSRYYIFYFLGRKREVSSTNKMNRAGDIMMYRVGTDRIGRKWKHRHVGMVYQPHYCPGLVDRRCRTEVHHR